MKNCFSILLLVSTAFLIGCFPVELSVSKDGQVLIPRQEGFCLLKTGAAEAKLIYSPKGEKPVWAAFTPDARSVLALSQGKGDMGDTNYTLRRMGIDGTSPKSLATLSNVLYARISPDGASVSLARAADAESKALAKKMPELLVVSTADGTKKPLLSDVAAVHRWTTDGKGILAVHVTSREKDGDQYVGKLVTIAVADGKTTDAASVLAGDKIYMDVSPDGNKVLLTALKVLPAAQAVPAKSDDKPSLYEIDLRSGQVRLLKQKALLGVYSPKGDKVLAATEGGEGTTELSVASGDMKEFKTIATDAAKSAGSSEIYPGWLNNDTVLYVGLRAVYGTEAKNFQLFALSADGKTRRNFQPTIDQAAEQK